MWADTDASESDFHHIMLGETTRLPCAAYKAAICMLQWPKASAAEKNQPGTYINMLAFVIVVCGDKISGGGARKEACVSPLPRGEM